MPLVRRLRRGSLLVRFAVVTAVLTAVLGLVLGQLLSSTIAERARSQALWTAIVTVRMGLQSQLTPEDLDRGFDPDRFAGVEHAVHAAAAGEVVEDGQNLGNLDPVELEIYNRSSTVVYADDRMVIGRRSHSAELEEALSGDVGSGLITDPAGDGERQLLVAYVPLTYAGSDTPAGAMVLYLPYAPVAAAISADIRMMLLTLAGSLAVFYVALFRFFALVQRRLHRQTRDLRRSAERNRYQATHDALTGLPNREQLRRRLDAAVTRADDGGEVAVLLVDLDRFKEINDTLGHTYGDNLLRQVGPRLRTVLRDTDTVARLGGDEFAVLLPVADGAREARRVADRVQEALHRPFDVEGLLLDVEASIGIALSPQHGTDSEVLLRNADVAMYVAKDVKGGAVVFSPEEHATAPSRLNVLGDLRRALGSDDELFLHYQPKYTLDGEQIEGLEALLRWQHPDRGLVPPADFIPVAEGTGIIMRLTERVLDLALRQQRAWLRAGHDVPVAVNLSTRCLLDPSLPELVADLLARHGVPARLLRLEVTESAVMGDAARCLDVLQRLHDLGVRLSIDDFGTGYSSMAYLRQLPVDELKIDRSFVMGMTGSQQDAVLVRTAIDLGHNLGLTVVAEGVEGPGHVTALQALGCDIAQGFHYARPMPAAAVAELLDRVGVLPDTGAVLPARS